MRDVSDAGAAIRLGKVRPVQHMLESDMRKTKRTLLADGDDIVVDLRVRHRQVVHNAPESKSPGQQRFMTSVESYGDRKGGEDIQRMALSSAQRSRVVDGQPYRARLSRLTCGETKRLERSKVESAVSSKVKSTGTEGRPSQDCSERPRFALLVGFSMLDLSEVAAAVMDPCNIFPSTSAGAFP